MASILVLKLYPIQRDQLNYVSSIHGDSVAGEVALVAMTLQNNYLKKVTGWEAKC